MDVYGCGRIDAEEENMINAFPKSRCVAWTGGAVLGAAAGISAWLYMAGRAASLFNRAIVALLAAFIAVNIALYIARLMAAREYQKRLLLLYEALDPSAFLQALLPLRKKRYGCFQTAAPRWCILPTDISTAVSRRRHWRCWKMCSHRRKALEMAGLVAGNKATCFLAAGEMDRAQTAMDELRRIAADRNCKKEFVQKARHTLGYLQLCMDIARGRHADVGALQKDFESSRAPLHRLDVQYRIALALRHRGDRTGWRKAANISLRTVAVPATASLRVHFDTCERYKKARLRLHCPGPCGLIGKVYFFPHHHFSSWPCRYGCVKNFSHFGLQTLT
jgi:hypothetical protein